MDVQFSNGKITAPTFEKNAVLSNDVRPFFLLKGEHNRKWTAENPNNRIGIRLKIDGGLITNNNQNKCDGGLLLCNNHLYLVEFKGGDEYKAAVNQLIETKEYLKKKYDNYNLIYYARIVGKSFPKASTELQKAKRDLKNNFGNNFRLFENEGKETI